MIANIITASTVNLTSYIVTGDHSWIPTGSTNLATLISIGVSIVLLSLGISMIFGIMSISKGKHTGNQDQYLRGVRKTIFSLIGLFSISCLSGIYLALTNQLW